MKRAPGVIAGLLHSISVLNRILSFEFLWIAQRFNFANALLGFIASILVQSFFFKTITVLFLSREFGNDHVNQAWWSGRWISANLGIRVLSQPFREYLCKIIEMSMFAMDFTLGHFLLFIQTPILFIPYVDRWHSAMLFWLRPKQVLKPPVFSTKQAKLRRRLVRRYSLLYILVMIAMLVPIIGPVFIPAKYKQLVANLLDSFYPGIIQPITRLSRTVAAAKGMKP